MFDSGASESLDGSCCALPPAARACVWLVDLERVCALLIGRCLGGMLVGFPMSTEERETSGWLLSPLFAAGLHKCTPELGTYCIAFIFFLVIRTGHVLVLSEPPVNL